MRSDLKGRTILVTGSTDGIGTETALELAGMGANVLIHGRNKEKGQKVMEEISHKSGNDQIELYIADLSSQREIRMLAREVQERHDNLHVLINNAGVYMPQRRLTQDGIEMTFAVNFLAPFLLTGLLLDLLKRSAPSRIINVSSIAHMSARVDWTNIQGERHYDGYNAYALSKLALILFTYRLAEEPSTAGVTVNCLHPGVINTKLLRTGFGPGGASVEEGAQTPVFLASAPDLENVTGKYFVDRRVSQSSPMTRDKNLQERFWKLGEKFTGMQWGLGQ
jgi:NAD(P)-dependent dehydrogenase (short-subunit alcohol dehydrogenase family)